MSLHGHLRHNRTGRAFSLVSDMIENACGGIAVLADYTASGVALMRYLWGAGRAGVRASIALDYLGDAIEDRIARGHTADLRAATRDARTNWQRADALGSATVPGQGGVKYRGHRVAFDAVSVDESDVVALVPGESETRCPRCSAPMVLGMGCQACIAALWPEVPPQPELCDACDAPVPPGAECPSCAEARQRFAGTQQLYDRAAVWDAWAIQQFGEEILDDLPEWCDHPRALHQTVNDDLWVRCPDCGTAACTSTWFGEPPQLAPVWLFKDGEVEDDAS